MATTWRTQWTRRRVRPGDGRALKPFRWWQMLVGRALLHLDLTGPDGRPVRWSVDVRHQGDADGRVVAHLYRDGRHDASSRVPALLPAGGGEIEVRTSAAGLRRCHWTAPDGTVRPLTPDPRSAEGRRARLERRRPGLSRAIGAVSVLALVVGLGLNLLQIAGHVSRIPPIAETIGVFVSPVVLPVWLNVTLGLAAALGAAERALRMRHHWLLDAAGT
ncbi:hypothetical protein [Pseudonocardia spirodelae]|uniref:Uncharacterized protein n=1 Tax=Pseudonocardia spirodelae TaxID=3133431 RepID=A0ABU8TCN0_9PSEU